MKKFSSWCCRQEVDQINAECLCPTCCITPDWMLKTQVIKTIKAVKWLTALRRRTGGKHLEADGFSHVCTFRCSDEILNLLIFERYEVIWFPPLLSGSAGSRTRSFRAVLLRIRWLKWYVDPPEVHQPQLNGPDLQHTNASSDHQLDALLWWWWWWWWACWRFFCCHFSLSSPSSSDLFKLNFILTWTLLF